MVVFTLSHLPQCRTGIGFQPLRRILVNPPAAEPANNIGRPGRRWWLSRYGLSRVLADRAGLTLKILQVNGHNKVYWIKRSLVLSEPGMLCEMFATLGLDGEGTSEEQAIKLNVIPEDFETLVHYYNDFEFVTLQSSSFSELTRWTPGRRGSLPMLPRFNTGIS